ncbi:MAG: polyprenyl synthetase family protein [Pseudomonadota bacterium]
MTFEARLSACATKVEDHLDACLSKDERVPPDLRDAMRHAALGGGKRLRPFLVMECAGLFDVAPEAALPTACALELVHCYSLVHDDLPAMDDDDLRRGRPTVHVAFNEWTAILAGDALLTLAFDVLAQDATDNDPAVRCRLIAALARASGWSGMVGGQQLDLEADKLNRPAEPSLDHILALQAMKTGALITYACEAGGLLGRASSTDLAALRAYGHALGRAFQIADDLLDVEGDAAAVGKAVGKDAAAGKATLVSLMGIEAARARLATFEAEAIDALSPFADRAATLQEAARFISRRDR